MQGSEKNAILNLFGDTEGKDYIQNDCQIGVLALDGVYLSSAPRIHDYKSIQLSISGRVDVAIFCPASTSNQAYSLPIKLQPYDKRIGTLVVKAAAVSSVLVEDAALPQWQPCRPYYLMDLTDLPQSIHVSDNLGITVRDSVNGLLFNPEIYFATDWEEGEIKQWTVDGTDVHPFHVHVNHMQFLDDPENFPGVSGFYKAGDWVDTVNAPGSPVVRTRLDRFSGNIFLHCHVYSHSDAGVVAIANVNHGYGPLSTLSTLKHGTCPLPRPKPYGGDGPTPIPGVLESAYFDDGGMNVGYFTIPEPDMPDPLHNEYDPQPVNIKRQDSALGIEESSDTFEGGNYELLGLKAGDWMAYTIEVENFYSNYEITMRVAGRIIAPSDSPGLEIWVKIDNNDCSSKEEILVIIKDPQWGGSSRHVALAGTTTQDKLTKGQHTLSVCMIKGIGIRLSTISIDAISMIEYSNSGGGYSITASVPGTVQAASYFDETGESAGRDMIVTSDMATSITKEYRIDENSMIHELSSSSQQLGDTAVEFIKPWQQQQNQSYAIEVQRTGNYSLGLFMVSGTKELLAPTSHNSNLALHCVIGSTDCSTTPAWSGVLVANNFAQSFQILYTPIANSMLLVLKASSRTLLTLCWDSIPNSDVNLQLGSFFLALDTDSEGIPSTAPYNGKKGGIMLPGVIPATHHNIPLRGFEGEGIAWHAIQAVNDFDLDYNDTMNENGGDEQLSKHDVDWLQITQNNTWLVYSVEFTEAGTHHAVLNLAGKPKTLVHQRNEFMLQYRIMLNTRNCESTEDGALLMESIDNDFTPSGGFGQFAPHPSLTSFEVSEEMVSSGPQIIVLCFMVISTMGVSFASMEILQGASSGKRQKLCYIEPCFSPPGTMYMENYDYEGSGLTFYNKEKYEHHTDHMVRYNDVHAAPELIRHVNGDVFLEHIYSGEWLSFTVKFNGMYHASLILQSLETSEHYAEPGGLTLHMALDSIDCVNHDRTVMRYNDQHWNGAGEPEIQFQGTLEAYGEHIITLCFDHIPTGHIAIHSVKWHII